MAQARIYKANASTRLQICTEKSGKGWSREEKRIRLKRRERRSEEERGKRRQLCLQTYDQCSAMLTLAPGY